MIDELVQELRSYPAHYVAAHRAAAALEQREYYNCRLEADLVKLEAAAESLREHIAEQQLDIVTLGLEVGKLREVLKQYACQCSSPCWYPKENSSCGLNAKRATE
jgi:hypothetical protein